MTSLRMLNCPFTPGDSQHDEIISHHVAPFPLPQSGTTGIRMPIFLIPAPRLSEAECFTTNDSDVRCPPLNPTTPACSVRQLLHTQRDSILPPTCSMTLAIIVFTTMAGVLLSITTAATIICRNIRRVQMDVQMTQTDATPFATPNSSVHGSKVENLEEEEGEDGHRLTDIPGDSPAYSRRPEICSQHCSEQFSRDRKPLFPL